MILDLDQYAITHGAKTKEALVYALRQEYNSCQQIISLIGTELKSADPDLITYCDKQLALSFDSLGNCFFDCWDGVRQALGNGYALASKPTTGDMRGKFAGLPVLVLGAGPSVNGRWEQIRTACGHVILIVCDVMLPACLSRGIIPDYVCAQERTPQVAEALEGQNLEGITLIAPPVIDPRVVEMFGGRVIWCWRGCTLETWIDPTIPRNNFGRSCGVLGIGAALLSGCSHLYLIGFDMCMDGENTHASGSHPLTTGTKDSLDTDAYHRQYTAKSVSGRDVKTIHLWQMFKADIEYIIAEHPLAIVCNSGDGLPITGAISWELPEIWAESIEIPRIERSKPGINPRFAIEIMRQDITALEKMAVLVAETDTPDHTMLMLSRIVDPKTAGLWTEIFASVYGGSLIRLHLRPDQSVSVLKRAANTIKCSLPHIKAGLDSL